VIFKVPKLTTLEVWMLAAFLPLPKRPPAYANPDALPSAAQMSEYSSQPYPNSVFPSDISLNEKRWQKARWWRTVNRLMSILGLLIIGAIVRNSESKTSAYMDTRIRDKAANSCVF
jgi:hypothetical protein